MVAQSIQDQILQFVNQMSEDKQQQVLDFARELNRPAGIPIEELKKYVGTITPEDAALMQQAIEEAFEQINIDEW